MHLGYHLSADPRSRQEMTMRTDRSPVSRRPEAATEQTGQIDMAAVMAKLDEVERKATARHRPVKAKRPMSWSAALTIVLVVLGVLATIVLLAALHVIPAL